MAFRAIHDLVGRYRSDPRTCWRHYEKVAGLKESVKEVEIGYSQRMLVYPTPGGLTLLAVGGHDIVGSYGDGLLPSDLDTAECAPPEFWPDQKLGFFTREISYDVQPFTHTEYLPEWVYYLADEQDQAASDIMEGIEGLLTGDAHNPVRFIAGGPGTGKTCVLLSLLRRCQRMGISAQIAMPDAVLKYIQACTEFPSPAAYAGSPYEAIVQATSDVLLVDDPANLYEIRAAMHRVRAGDIRVAVFAFDPLQMSRALPDQDFDALVDEHDVDWYKLKSCYRQKANVGAATRKAADAIAKSSPYAARDKIVRFAKAHRELTALANDLTFINPHGYAEVYEEATVDDFAKEVKRIRTPYLWRHWPALLVSIDEENSVQLPKGWSAALRGIKHETVSLNGEVQRIKGLEYQHVFLLLSRRLYEELEDGFAASGRRVYGLRRLLRIPFSRAKDSLVIFVVDG